MSESSKIFLEKRIAEGCLSLPTEETQHDETDISESLENLDARPTVLKQCNYTMNVSPWQITMVTETFFFFFTSHDVAIFLYGLESSFHSLKLQTSLLVLLVWKQNFRI